MSPFPTLPMLFRAAGPSHGLERSTPGRGLLEIIMPAVGRRPLFRSLEYAAVAITSAVSDALFEQIPALPLRP